MVLQHVVKAGRDQLALIVQELQARTTGPTAAAAAGPSAAQPSAHQVRSGSEIDGVEKGALVALASAAPPAPSGNSLARAGGVSTTKHGEAATAEPAEGTDYDEALREAIRRIEEAAAAV